MNIDEKLAKIKNLFEDGYELHSVGGGFHVDIENDEIRMLNFRKDNLESSNISIVLDNLQERKLAKPLISENSSINILDDNIFNVLTNN